MTEIISAEEVELLAQKGDIQAKKDAGENLETEETETLTKITSLEDDLKERFKETDTPEKTKEEIISLQAQKVHFREKYGKESAKVKDLEEKLALLEKKNPTEETTETKIEDNKRLDGVEFLIANRDVTKDEFDFISAVARGKGITLEASLVDEGVKTFLEATRAKSTSDSKVPGPTSNTRAFVRDENVFKEGDTEIERQKKFNQMQEDFRARKVSKSGV